MVKERPKSPFERLYKPLGTVPVPRKRAATPTFKPSRAGTYQINSAAGSALHDTTVSQVEYTQDYDFLSEVLTAKNEEL
jgi:hypothetical protein